MNKKKIEKLRKKFVLVASLSFFIVMLFMGGLMFLTNLLSVRGEILSVLNLIVENDGELDGHKKIWSASREADASESDEGEAQVQTAAAFVAGEVQTPGGLRGIDGEALKRWLGMGDWVKDSKEFIYSTRFFAVLFDADMNVEEVKTNHIAAVEKDEAEEYAQQALKRPLKFGSIDQYYYKVAPRENGGTIVVYLESMQEIYSNNRLMYTALILIGVGSIFTLILVRFFSYRIVREEIQNIEMQDRFMTNASHELKTPLAVIKANTEVEQMLNGENEWNQSTMRQVERMTGLIQNLIRIVRAEEKENSEPLRRINVSEVLQETVDTFRSLASQEAKQLESELQPDVSFWMREVDIRQLVSLLLDNAIKYCDEQGTVNVHMRSKGNTLRVTVSNSYAAGADTDYSRFFERFYREDQSHNVEKGGYGIGLSIAENLVERYRGKLQVDWKDGIISFVCVLYQSRKQ